MNLFERKLQFSSQTSVLLKPALHLLNTDIPYNVVENQHYACFAVVHFKEMGWSCH
jgi:hypothetical protein